MKILSIFIFNNIIISFNNNSFNIKFFFHIYMAGLCLYLAGWQLKEKFIPRNWWRVLCLFLEIHVFWSLFNIQLIFYKICVVFVSTLTWRHLLLCCKDLSKETSIVDWLFFGKCRTWNLFPKNCFIQNQK